LRRRVSMQRSGFTSGTTCRWERRDHARADHGVGRSVRDRDPWAGDAAAPPDHRRRARRGARHRALKSLVSRRRDRSTRRRQ
jgi:hypothetical protein